MAYYIKNYFNAKTFSCLIFLIALFFAVFFGYFYVTGKFIPSRPAVKMGDSGLKPPLLLTPQELEILQTSSMMPIFSPLDLEALPEVTYVLSRNTSDPALTLDISTFTYKPVYLEKLELKLSEGQKSIQALVYKDQEVICQSAGASAGDIIELACDRYILDTLKTSWQAVAQPRQRLIIQSSAEIDFLKIKKLDLTFRYLDTYKKVKDVSGVVVDRRVFANLTDISRTPAQFVAAHPAFRLIDDNRILLPAGVHTFRSTVVIPRQTQLTIAPGAVISLVNDATFVSYSPVVAKGTVAQPIIVRGEADGVGENFVVLDNEELSVFEHVQFSGGGESSVNGAFFSGMLALHHADSIIRYNSFENARGDDALNIKYASSTVAYNVFKNNTADAIDYDFSDGAIESNIFVNNGNDAIDTSGSPVRIQYNDIQRSGDKCVSVGEMSTPLIFNNVLDGCRVGIEVKDLSAPLILNNVIINNGVAVNGYQKKPIFGGGHGKVYNSIIWDNKKNIVLDQMSDIIVSHSAVEGDYSREKNFSLEPIFTDTSTRDFTNSARASLEYQQGGEVEALREYTGLEMGSAPVGLVKKL